MTRRDFLKATGAGAASAAAIPAMGQLTQRPLATGTRLSSPTRFALELDGTFAGWLSSAVGGFATSDVVTERVGPDRIVRKHLAGVKYEEVTLTCGPGMSKSFYQWITDSLNRNITRKNGAIIAADFNFRETSRLTFFNALISEIGFPALDASSKDAAYMTLKFKPEITRFTAGPGKTAFSASKGEAQKRWLPANFRLKIAGLETACSRVNKIEALAIKQKIADSSIGRDRISTKEPASIEIPNLALTAADSHSAELYKWHEEFVIKGNNTQDKEKSGTLEFLTPNLADVLFTLNFKGLGIFKCSPEKAEAGAESIRRVRAEMYCEELMFDPKMIIG